MGKCSKCRFSVKQGELFYCHLNPPSPVSTAPGSISFVWPAMQPDGWCAQFKASLKRLFRGHAAA